MAFFKKAFPDRKSKVLAIVILTLVVLGIGFLLYSKFAKKDAITADYLINNYIQTNEIASLQKMTTDIKTNYGNVSFELENERDKDTDHITVQYKSPVSKKSEYYVDKIDQQVGIYLKNGSKWNFELKSKQSIVDDPRTEFIEISNSSSEISLANFNNLELVESDIENTYKCKANINGHVLLNFLGNNYQVLYVNYNSLASYFAKYNENIAVQCELYFNKNKTLKTVIFNIPEDNFKESNKKSVDVQINSLKITLSNESYETNNVYVSEDIEKNTISVKSLQSDDLLKKVQSKS